jgi:3-deoxy-D-manno-octulosonic-acid transferase
MNYFFDFLYLLAVIIISPVAIYRMIRYKRYRKGWANRLGNIHRKDPALKKCVWLHAVSVGEVNAAKTIIAGLKNKFPQFEIVLTTTTDTGFARANEVYGDNIRIFYFPFDFSWIMQKAFANIQPTLCLLIELEVWPNFVQTSHQFRAPVVVVNGRISDRGFNRYKKVNFLTSDTFRRVNLVLVQTEEYARRFRELGCRPEKVFVTGSLKYDTAQVADKVDGADTLAAQLGLGDGKLWVAGATGNDEEKIILDVYKKLKQQFADLRLAIVPRKPERFEEVAQLIEQTGLPFVRYSEIKTAASKIQNLKSKIDIILGDTIGDLRKFYSLADIIFIGRSLVPMGGSDMMEAAALGKCTIFGPYAFNFQQTVDALLADNGAIMVKDSDGLLQMMQKCLFEPDFAATIASNGQEVIRKNQGATAKTIQHISKLLKHS